MATEFSIDLEFVATSIETMKKLRDDKLPRLLQEYQIQEHKQKHILQEVSKRTLQGALK